MTRVEKKDKGTRRLNRVQSEDSDDASMIAIGTDDSYEDAVLAAQEERENNGMDRYVSLRLSRDAGSTAKALSLQHDESFEGVAFDLNQPWQRALKQELDRIQASSITERPRAELLLLGRAESGDYAIALDQDDATVMTNSSATVPTKPQIIHRLSAMSQALFRDDDDGSLCKSLGQSTAGNNSAFPSLYDSNPPVEDDRDELPMAYKNVEVVRQDMNGNSNTEALPRKRQHMETSTRLSVRNENTSVADQPPMLEMEIPPPSYVLDDTSALPEPACFCLGYNVLDFWLPPPSRSYRKHRRAHSRASSMPKLEGIVEEATTEPLESCASSPHTTPLATTRKELSGVNMAGYGPSNFLL